MSNTIVALSTARGRAAIAVVRMSGDDAIAIAKQFFSPFPSKPNMLKVGTLKTEYFDEHAMCVYFVAPHSYTGENTVEFHCHGGTAVAQAVIEQCLAHGAVMAQNGEFSKRAFLNGKQNLTNAEGIIEMIDAETASAAKAGANLLENKLGKRIMGLQNELLDVISACEVALDYPEEDLELPTVETAQKQLQSVLKQLDELISTSTLGKVAKYGIDVAIVGAPNVGKSSLLNALLGCDRAIVSDVQGTTRDTLTESVNYRDIRFNFVDTAGLRDTTDVVEVEGVKRAKIAADKADVVLHVTDDPTDRSVYPTIRPQVRIYNKCDLFDNPPCCVDSLVVSAKSGDVDVIKETLYEMFSAGEIENSDLLITNERHLSCLKLAKKQLVQAIADSKVATLDVVASSARQAWETLGQITGTSAHEDIIDRIYSKFCLGK
ncbi:MAG: tRNA uridine-5-carboxymethylaminomethyl(34) synthesis GTPase MnmE [Clostridiales bacterium]|nr:tRNA uridine-5-carboxymethylaminomethyl(34) synthesis GTPase MnmE [Clostridiales bacterium]